MAIFKNFAGLEDVQAAENEPQASAFFAPR